MTNSRKLWEKDQKALRITKDKLGKNAIVAVEHFQKADQRFSEAAYLLKNKKLKTAEDYYNASFIFLHAEYSLEGFALGALTALVAMRIGYESANKIYASCSDRFCAFLDMDVLYSRYGKTDKNGKFVHRLKNKEHLKMVNAERRLIGLESLELDRVVFSN